MIFLAGALVAFTSDQFFRVRTIEFTGDGVRISIDPERIEKNLLFLSASRMEDDLLIAYPELKEVIVKKKIPQTLVISASLRSPIARLETDTHAFMLDREGVVLPLTDSSAILPVIRIHIDTVRVGDSVHDEGISAALAFLTEFENEIPILSIEKKDTLSLRAKTDKTDIFIPQGGDMRILAATLQTMFLGFRIKGSLPALIDLRFDKPIVTF